VEVRDNVAARLGPYRVARLKRAVAPLLRNDLTRLGSFYGTNKAIPPQMYTLLYERHLRHRRRDPVRILEIGIGGYELGTGGSSLRMWRTYFPNARVYGIDLYPRDLREPRIETFCGSQADPDFLRDVVARMGPPDLVVDDGSHVGSDVEASFEILFPLVSAGGTYVIEDTTCSYRADFGGGPPGTAGTSIELVKRLADEPTWPLVAKEPVASWGISALHIYPGIVFIEKLP
jgi:demethylmacrocin O-methyltransferase